MSRPEVPAAAGHHAPQDASARALFRMAYFELADSSEAILHEYCTEINKLYTALAQKVQGAAKTGLDKEIEAIFREANVEHRFRSETALKLLRGCLEKYQQAIASAWSRGQETGLNFSTVLFSMITQVQATKLYALVSLTTARNEMNPMFDPMLAMMGAMQPWNQMDGWGPAMQAWGAMQPWNQMAGWGPAMQAWGATQATDKSGGANPSAQPGDTTT